MKGIIVLGAAGSGTRITTRILVKNGVFGSSRHKQVFDNYIEKGQKIINKKSFTQYSCIVVRRSLPHWRSFPDLLKILDFYKELGIRDIQFVIVYRHPRYSAISQLKRHDGLIKNIEEGVGNVNRAIEIIKGLKIYENKYKFIPFSYDMLVRFPRYMQRYLCESLNLEYKNYVKIKDANKKYEKI